MHAIPTDRLDSSQLSPLSVVSNHRLSTQAQPTASHAPPPPAPCSRHALAGVVVRDFKRTTGGLGVRVLGLGSMQAFVGVDDLVVAIHAATGANGQRFSFAVTGGGARARPLQFHNFILSFILTIHCIVISYAASRTFTSSPLQAPRASRISWPSPALPPLSSSSPARATPPHPSSFGAQIIRCVRPSHFGAVTRASPLSTTSTATPPLSHLPPSHPSPPPTPHLPSPTLHEPAASI